MVAGKERAEAVVEPDDGGGYVVGDVLDEMKEGERGEIGDDEALAYVEGDAAVLDGVDKAEGLFGCLLEIGEGARQLFELVIELVHAFHHNDDLERREGQ